MYENGDAPAAQSSTQKSNFTLLSILSKENLIGPNYTEWMRNMKMTLQHEKRKYVLKKPLVEMDESTSTPKEIVALNKHHEVAIKVACI